jgi:aminoglycoside phosphotransferase (APT) family kinase protein
MFVQKCANLTAKGIANMSATSGSLRDQPTTVRAGEEIDLERLGQWLRTMLNVDGEPAVLQYPSGYSNLTYLLRFGDLEVVLRRPPHGSKPKTGHDMKREHAILTAIHRAFPYCPRPLALCEDDTVIGCPFFVMERLHGIIVRREFPPGLALQPKDVRALFDRLVDVLVELHALEYRALGLEGFGQPQGYVARQVSGWCGRYRRARTPDVPDGEDLMAWLERNLPADNAGCIIHNDYRLDNVVLETDDPLHIVGVLDWEMATLGDPLMDLGSALAYWVESGDPPAMQALRMMPTTASGAPSRREVISRYARSSGRPIDDFDFYYRFGLFRLAGIAQQIYYRSYHGQTADPRFRALGTQVKILVDAAATATVR